MKYSPSKTITGENIPAGGVADPAEWEFEEKDIPEILEIAEKKLTEAYLRDLRKLATENPTGFIELLDFYHEKGFIDVHHQIVVPMSEKYSEKEI